MCKLDFALVILLVIVVLDYIDNFLFSHDLNFSQINDYVK